MSNSVVTVAVTGAAGQIGYALLFRIASGAMLGPNTRICLRLIELPQALSALEGVVMELQDCAFPLLDSVEITSDSNIGFSGVDWALLVGAAPRKAGMERADLLKMNGGIFAQQGAALNLHANPGVKVLVVGNPCNTNCLVAMTHAPDRSPQNFFAMTMLDQHRACAQLAVRAHVPVSAVERMIIFGNHSATQFPSIDHALINGDAARSVIQDEVWLEGAFIETVQQRGAAVIEARGASSAASAANAAIDTVASIEGVRLPGVPFSVGLCSNGAYGAEVGLIVSYPVTWAEGTLQVDAAWQHTEWSRLKMQASFDELAAERDQVKALDLV